MVTPGLYKHIKGKNYRVLFTADWLSKSAPEPDEILQAFIVSNRIFVSDMRDIEGREHFGEALVLNGVRWSGNTGDVDDDLNNRVVIYVALYGDGRVAARPEKEFEEIVDAPNRAPFEDPSDQCRQARFTRLAD